SPVTAARRAHRPHNDRAAGGTGVRHQLQAAAGRGEWRRCAVRCRQSLDYMIVWEYAFLAVDEPAGGFRRARLAFVTNPPHASSPDDGVPGCGLVSAWLMPQ